MTLLHISLAFTNPAGPEPEDEPTAVTGLTARIRDSQISTPISVSMASDGSNLIHNGDLTLADDGVLEFWTPYTKDISIQVFNVANELVYQERFGPVVQASGLVVTRS